MPVAEPLWSDFIIMTAYLCNIDRDNAVTVKVALRRSDNAGFRLALLLMILLFPCCGNHQLKQVDNHFWHIRLLKRKVKGSHSVQSL